MSLLGKKGDLSIILKTMGQLSAIDRPIIGQKANLIKIDLQELITERKNQLNDQALNQKIKNEKIASYITFFTSNYFFSNNNKCFHFR